MPLKYFEELHYLHEKWLSNKDLLPAPVLVIDANVDLNENPNAHSKYDDEILQHFNDKMGTKTTPLREVNRRLHHLLI